MTATSRPQARSMPMLTEPCPEQNPRGSRRAYLSQVAELLSISTHNPLRRSRPSPVPATPPSTTLAVVPTSRDIPTRRLASSRPRPVAGKCAPGGDVTQGGGSRRGASQWRGRGRPLPGQRLARRAPWPRPSQPAMASGAAAPGRWVPL